MDAFSNDCIKLNFDEHSLDNLKQLEIGGMLMALRMLQRI